jgi:hypothetical protein
VVAAQLGRFPQPPAQHVRALIDPPISRQKAAAQRLLGLPRERVRDGGEETVLGGDVDVVVAPSVRAACVAEQEQEALHRHLRSDPQLDAIDGGDTDVPTGRHLPRVRRERRRDSRDQPGPSKRPALICAHSPGMHPDLGDLDPHELVIAARRVSSL